MKAGHESCNLTFRGVVHPWMCDAMGHMNVRHYTGLYDDCCWHVLTFIMPSGESDAGWVAGTMTIEFLREVAPRAMLVLNPTVVRIGSKSISTRIEMRDASTGIHYSTGNFVSVLFDLKARTSLVLPDDVRSRASSLSTQPPRG